MPTPTHAHKLTASIISTPQGLLPVSRVVPADLETPVSAYLKLATGRYSFLLESADEGERLSRYSIIGPAPYMVLRIAGESSERIWLSGAHAGETDQRPCTDALACVRAELDRRPLLPVPEKSHYGAGAYGYLAYEVAARLEPSVPIPEADPLGLPESVFCFVDTLVLFDHVHHMLRLMTYVDLDEVGGDELRARHVGEERLDALEHQLARRSVQSQGSPNTHTAARRILPSPLASRERYKAAVRQIKRQIRAGECYQVVPSRRLALATPASPLAIYRALRQVNPSPYMFLFALDDFAVAGASPELLVRVRDGEVHVHPIAGTRRRGADASADAALEVELLADEKERAEHVMLVDLGRNDVGRVSEPGSVRVTQLFDVERYSHVMHLVSHVTGRLRAGLCPDDALRAAFPAGTVSGAPKVRAMQILAELEGERRGVYAGAVGYLGFDGSIDTCIAIRTLVLKDGVAYAQAGAGIVADSDPIAECDETESKMRAVINAIKEAEATCCS